MQSQEYTQLPRLAGKDGGVDRDYDDDEVEEGDEMIMHPSKG